jgi:hypothetical protein
MVSYLGLRLLTDFLKPIPRFGGLGTIQWTCLAVLVYYAPDLRRWLAHGLSRHPQLLDSR